MAERNFQLSSGSTCDANQLPSNFTSQRLLGKGSYGKVLRCIKKDTKQTVAVKIPLERGECTTEVPMMENLMILKLDQQNIVQFLGWFPTKFGKAMVFESLDISLDDFVRQRHCVPMPLSDIRDIIEQLAIALNALKLNGVIHTDVKLDNVMMVDHQRQPYRVKLIDFGMAFHRSKAQQGITMQVPAYRAPEIILGLPFSEAIDIWSLGSVMAIMLHGGELFPGDTEYEVLLEINSLLGLPDDHVLEKGLKTKQHFNKTECGSWKLKTHHEYGGKQREYKPLMNTLDTFRKARLEKGNAFEAVQRPMCINLLEAMVKLDETERITPSEILTHPFIASTKPSSSIEERISFSRETKRPARYPTELRPAVNMVHPPAAEKCVLLDIEEEDSEVDEEPHTALDKGDNMDIDFSSPSPRASPPAVNLVCHLSSDEWLLLDTDEEDSESDTEDYSETVSSSPSLRATPPAVNLVCPPSAEDWRLLDADEEDSESDTEDSSETRRSSPFTPPGVMPVRPAAAENKLQHKEDRAVRLLRTYTVEVADKDIASSTNDCTRTEKKKRKNCVRRLFTWMKKNFDSCFSRRTQVRPCGGF